MNYENKNILFFDGVCTLCNGLIDFFLKRDTGGRLYFTSLQGETSKKILDPKMSEELNTIVLRKDGKVFLESDAILESLNLLGGLWKIMIVFKIIPSFIRDAVYRFVARNRYKWFGKEDTCRLPLPNEKDRLLD